MHNRYTGYSSPGPKIRSTLIVQHRYSKFTKAPRYSKVRGPGIQGKAG